MTSLAHLSRLRAVSVRRIVGTTWILATLFGCSADGLVGSSELPPDVVDPSRAQTAAGARAAYNSALSSLRAIVAGNTLGPSVALMTGFISDELTSGDLGQPQTNSPDIPDSRLYGNGDPAWQTYSGLHQVRAQSNQARGLIANYGAGDPGPLVGHLMAVTGYAELMLGEVFCSGIPLSTLDYNGNFTYRAGSTTRDVMLHASALFDSAMVLAADSARILNLARVGKGRALLQIGDFEGAAAAVASVPVAYRYTLSYTTGQANSYVSGSFILNDMQNARSATAADREGINGLPFRSSHDPRLPAFVLVGNGNYGEPIIVPDYGSDPFLITLASGIEAVLIRAEVALHAGDATWLDLVNGLRTDGTYTVSGSDTAWHAGTGGIAGLPPFRAGDYSTPNSRIDALFRERAMWMYLTGHRQGDLRRLVRLYGRPQATVFPTGSYRGITNVYGSDVVYRVPQAERNNPLFTGCIDRGA